jgi:hypothetical protein
MYPDPYQWTTDSGLTHIFYTNHLPPGEGFGWSSLCDEWHLPIEGEHFEWQEEVVEDSITCDHCREQTDKANVNLDDEEIVQMRSCLIDINRDNDGNIIKAERICRRRPLHYELRFEPDSFSGDLREQVDDVCEECWNGYFDDQWSGDVEGGELEINCWTDGRKQTYYAVSAEAINTGRQATLQLTSENGLTQEFPRENIESIRLTPAHIVDY